MRGKYKTLRIAMPHIVVASSILISHVVFHGEDFPTFISFIVLIPIFVIFKFDGRIPIVYALLVLTIAVIALTFYNETLANLLAIYAYWLLIVGIICLLVEFIKEKNENIT